MSLVTRAASMEDAEPPVDEEPDFDDTWFEGQTWRPEEPVVEDPIILNEARKQLIKIPKLLPSKFAEFAFRYPTEDEEGRGVDGSGYDRFDFGPRRHMRRIYDTPAKNVLLFCARQVEKSTLLGNRAITYMSMVPSMHILYVSPSATQTKKFSNDRLKEPIETSPVLKKFTTTMLSSNILEKQFVNRSMITLRYAFLNADRTRGIFSWVLLVDELQDMLGDNLPVIEQCLSHAPWKWRSKIYSGTPKSLDNTIETYWSTHSTMNEWVVPCECTGGDKGRYWNILGEKNIGLKGLICGNCGKLISPMGDSAQWATTGKKDAEFEGYRIPQLMVPWKPWSEILSDYKRFPRDRFYNEVLGLSYDSGMRPLTRAQIQACCKPEISMRDVEKYRPMGYSQPIFAGIDWGTGEHSYTVIVLAIYIDMKFRFFFMHRFEGEEIDPVVQVERIIELIDYFNVAIVSCDYGGGYDRNHLLTRRFGPQRVHKWQYVTKPKYKVKYDPKLGRWLCGRTEVMSDVFNTIKRANQIELPRWEDIETPYAQDMLNIYSEMNDMLRQIQYRHASDKPDDTFHAMTLCLLGSMLKVKRRDIFAPGREEKGKQLDEWRGPIYQG